MREVVFALEFRGRGGPDPGSPTRRRARTTAPSQVLRAALGPDGVSAAVEPIAGESAVLESRVERFPDGTFVEDGTITYGAAGSAGKNIWRLRRTRARSTSKSGVTLQPVVEFPRGGAQRI